MASVNLDQHRRSIHRRSTATEWKAPRPTSSTAARLAPNDYPRSFGYFSVLPGSDRAWQAWPRPAIQARRARQRRRNKGRELSIGIDARLGRSCSSPGIYHQHAIFEPPPARQMYLPTTSPQIHTPSFGESLLSQRPCSRHAANEARRHHTQLLSQTASTGSILRKCPAIVSAADVRVSAAGRQHDITMTGYCAGELPDSIQLPDSVLQQLLWNEHASTISAEGFNASTHGKAQRKITQAADSAGELSCRSHAQAELQH